MPSLSESSDLQTPVRRRAVKKIDSAAFLDSTGQFRVRSTKKRKSAKKDFFWSELLSSYVCPLSGRCLAHVSPMSRPCLAHVSPMSRPCLAHVSPMSLPCLAHVSPMSLPCLAQYLASLLLLPFLLLSWQCLPSFFLVVLGLRICVQCPTQVWQSNV